MSIENIRQYVNERVKPVDFSKILLEDGPDDSAPADDAAPPADESPADDGGFDDTPPADDLGGGDDLGGDIGGGGDLGGFGGGPSGGSSSSGDDAPGDDTTGTDDKFRDREDDPDFKGAPAGDGSPNDRGPAAVAIYDFEGVLAGLNKTIQGNDIDLAEIDAAKNVLELVVNGKKLIDDDFKDIQNNESFSDIIKRSIESVDEKTKNYVTMKIKEALLNFQNAKKIDANKANGEVEQVRDITDKI